MLFSPKLFLGTRDILGRQCVECHSLQTLPRGPWLNRCLKAVLELWSHSFVAVHEFNFVLEIFQSLW